MAAELELDVLVVDDHELVRTGMRRLLEDHEMISSIDEASSGEVAVSKVSKRHYHLVLMDFHLPGMTGLEASERVLAADPATRIVIITGTLEGSLTRQLMDCGVRGYITKGSSAEDMDQAIRHAMRDERYLSRDVANRVAQDALNGNPDDPFEKLTVRERQIVELLLDGKRNRRIAEKLFISEKTVSTHRTRAFEKLDVDTTAQLVRLAMRHGMWRED